MAATFTVPACPDIEAHIASDLALLRDAILNTVGQSHVQTLVLGGGFGRGEGTAYITSTGPRIVNDYDIRIIHDLPSFFFHLRYGGKLAKVAEGYAQRLAIKQIDLGSQNYRDLSRIPDPTIANYEFFHGYQVFYGEDLLEPIAIQIPVERIPLWEGTWLLRNRSIGLILAGLYFLDRQFPSEEKSENLWIETNKAMLAVGDVFLLAQGCYHWSYAERGRRMFSWPGIEADSWREAYCKAVALKVDPSGCPYSRPLGELIQGWYEARDTIEQGFRWFEVHRTGRELKSWGDYLDQCIESPPLFRLYFWLNILRAKTISPRAAVLRARLRTERIRSVGLAARLLFAVSADGINEEALNHVARVMGLQPCGSPTARWRNLAAILIGSIHPTGEARRVAEEVLKR